MQTLIRSTKQVGFLTIALTLALVANFTYGQWAAPTEAPTGGSIAAPINTGADLQHKVGNLRADQFHSDEYCAADGTGCRPVSGLGGGGGHMFTSQQLLSTSLSGVNVCGYSHVLIETSDGPESWDSMFLPVLPGVRASSNNGSENDNNKYARATINSDYTIGYYRRGGVTIRSVRGFNYDPTFPCP